MLPIKLPVRTAATDNSQPWTRLCQLDGRGPFISPCQDVNNDGAAHEEGGQRGFGFAVDRHQQHHHGDQAGHGHLPKYGSRQLAVRLEDVEGCSCGVPVAICRGHHLGKRNFKDFSKDFWN